VFNNRSLVVLSAVALLVPAYLLGAWLYNAIPADNFEEALAGFYRCIPEALHHRYAPSLVGLVGALMSLVLSTFGHKCKDFFGHLAKAVMIVSVVLVVINLWSMM
jgi:Flp pilus assembly pilin Flp